MPAERIITSKLQLTLETLPELSDAFAFGVNAEILEALRDCNNRPRLQKGRKVKIELIFTPIVDKDGKDDECNEVKVQFVIHPVGRPQRLPDSSRIKINKNNQGFFHADFPKEGPDAESLFEKQVVKKPLAKE